LIITINLVWIFHLYKQTYIYIYKRQAGINALHDDINSEKIMIKHVEKALFPLTQKVQEREQDFDTLVMKDCYKKFYENHV